MANQKTERHLYDELKRSIGHLPAWEEYIPAIINARILVTRFRRCRHIRRMGGVRRASPSTVILGSRYYSNIRKRYENATAKG